MPSIGAFAALAGAAAAAAQGATLLDEVHQDVVTERLRRREEGPTPVHLGQALHERLEVAVGVEHEGVDADAVAGAAGDFSQRGLDGLGHGRIVEEDLTVALDVAVGSPSVIMMICFVPL